MSINLYQRTPISLNLYQPLSTSIKMDQPLVISIYLHDPLAISINLYHFINLFTLYQSPAIFVNLDRYIANPYQSLSTSTNLYQSL